MSRPALVDASTLLAFVFNEPGGDLPDDFITGAYVTSVNMAEVIAVLNRQGFDGHAVAADLVEAGVTVVPMGWPHLAHVGRVQQAQRALELTRSLSLGDLCCLSHALEQNMHVWTADRDWARLGLDLEVTVVR